MGKFSGNLTRTHTLTIYNLWLLGIRCENNSYIENSVFILTIHTDRCLTTQFFLLNFLHIARAHLIEQKCLTLFPFESVIIKSELTTVAMTSHFNILVNAMNYHHWATREFQRRK